MVSVCTDQIFKGTHDIAKDRNHCFSRCHKKKSTFSLSYFLGTSRRRLDIGDVASASKGFLYHREDRIYMAVWLTVTAVRTDPSEQCR